MPGTDPLETMRVIFDELPDLPHLAELPDRGVGADMIGRTAGLLIDLSVDATPRGWRLADRPGRDVRRAQSLLSRDLDALEEVADGYQGPLKLQVCGPWTMAASLELARSQEPVLADPGAVRDLTASLAEGVAAHVAGVRARVPGARLLLQLDEPSLPAVLGGGVPSASGLNRVRPVEEGTPSRACGRCCPPRPPPPWCTAAECRRPLASSGARARTGRGSTSGCSAGGRKRCWPRRSRRASGSSWARCLPRRRRRPARLHQQASRGLTAPLPPLILRNETVLAPSPGPAGRGAVAPDGMAAAASPVLQTQCGGYRGPGRDHPGLRTGRCPAGLRPGRAGRLPGGGPDAPRAD